MTRKETVTTRKYTYTILLTRDEDGGFVVACPALPGLVTHGGTLEEARAMAADAIRGYLESLRKDGLPIPPGEGQGTEARREPVTVSLSGE